MSAFALKMMIKKITKNSYFYYGFFLSLIFVLLILPTSTLFSQQKSQPIFTHPLQPIVSKKFPVQLSTNYYILLDVATNKILASSRENERIYPASTTKLATALTALNVYPLNEFITISQEYTNGKTMDLKKNEKISIKNLVAGLLIYSANDAAYNLATQYSQGQNAFIDQMNLLMQKYGLKNTHFTNFDGLHDLNHYSTVYDLAQLGRIAIQNPTLKNFVKEKEMILTDVSGQISHHVISTNELLGVVPEIEGLKTGWTPDARGSFIGLINLRGHYLISVVAQSEDRFTDTKTLINWAKDNLTWRSYQ